MVIDQDRGRQIELMHALTFNRPLNRLLRVENVLLDELERSRSMTELVVQLVG